ncbi:MAG: hypothetical protein AAGI06_02160 [Pseudomonadota bacterium]
MKKNVAVRFTSKHASTAVAALFTAAVAASLPAHAEGEQAQSKRANTQSLPAYYEDLCAKQIDLGNDGDDWMDALEECEKLAKRLKQLEKTNRNSAQSS